MARENTTFSSGTLNIRDIGIGRTLGVCSLNTFTAGFIYKTKTLSYDTVSQTHISLATFCDGVILTVNL